MPFHKLIPKFQWNHRFQLKTWIPEIEICAARPMTFYLKRGREHVAFSSLPFSLNYCLYFFLLFCTFATSVLESTSEKGKKEGEMDFLPLESFHSPIGFCKRIKAVYWDSRKRFTMCLSSSSLLLCLSLFFPLPFTALVASLTTGYNNHTCPDSPGSVLSPCLRLPILLLLHIQTRPFSS